jgi:hypothetical protein
LDNFSTFKNRQHLDAQDIEIHALGTKAPTKVGALLFGGVANWFAKADE